MFKADVISLDDQVIARQAQVAGQSFLKGEGPALWRGSFHIPKSARGRVQMGDTLYLLLPDRGRIGTLVTEVAAPMVHFRARGRIQESD
ncbi:hypothetical protein Pan44_31350 [Caulifigura coniformis]|uniref:Uncharacterized protein n=1 Tax=Caulifigura coniformis TaxID=2527983 RepID=A0A517SG43_9PLAN|nr:hypothetical protein [Caulifigura coniformis]QDT55094.1 hypothetical protein Pan44_31350 [Caulifigura coniformis]